MGDRLYFERFVWFDCQVRKGHYPNTTNLAAKFECSAKTGQRSIEYFRDRLGAPLIYDQSRRGFYYDDPTFMFPVVRITESELVALLASHKLLIDAAAGPLGDELGKVSTKLGSLLSQNLPAGVNPERAFSFRWQGFSPGDPLVFQQIATSLLTCRPVTFCYYSPLSSACTMRTAEPHHMLNYMGAWHMVAFCRLRGEWRDFHLSRISMIKLEDDTFSQRDEEQWRPFLEGTFGIFQNHRRFEVTVRFSSERSRWVRDEVWHPDQRQEILEDGGVQITLPVSHEAEIMREVLKHGAHAEVVEPEWLRERIGEEILLMVKKYSQV
ncbi:MAG: WYL domain-containing protein [Desulfuromonadales bacterium]|nr:WYL domain-containing protein [Desulfuromonadales bacterium]